MRQQRLSEQQSNNNMNRNEIAQIIGGNIDFDKNEKRKEFEIESNNINDKISKHKHHSYRLLYMILIIAMVLTFCVVGGAFLIRMLDRT